MDLKALTRPEEPFALLYVGSSASAHTAVCELERSGKGGSARVLRGRKSMTAAALHDELAAALQFPPHYGENFDATRDCLRDLSWLRPGPVTLCILDAVDLLRSAPAKQFAQFASVIADTLSFWNSLDGKRKIVPFHLLLQNETVGDIEFRWKSAGVPLSRLT